MNWPSNLTDEGNWTIYQTIENCSHGDKTYKEKNIFSFNAVLICPLKAPKAFFTLWVLSLSKRFRWTCLSKRSTQSYKGKWMVLLCSWEVTWGHWSTVPVLHLNNTVLYERMWCIVYIVTATECLSNKAHCKSAGNVQVAYKCSCHS